MPEIGLEHPLLLALGKIYAGVALLLFLVTFRFLRPNTTNEHQDLTRSTPKTKNKNQILNVCVWFNSQ